MLCYFFITIYIPFPLIYVTSHPSGEKATMDHRHAMLLAEKAIHDLNQHHFDILNIARPSHLDYAINLGKFIAKLSPLMSTLIEFKVVDSLNNIHDLQPFGTWIRQDPGFPDAIFQGDITPAPGIEIVSAD